MTCTCSKHTRCYCRSCKAKTRNRAKHRKLEFHYLGFKRLFEEPSLPPRSTIVKVCPNCDNCGSKSILENKDDNTKTCEECGIEKNIIFTEKRGPYSEEIYASLKYKTNKKS